MTSKCAFILALLCVIHAASSQFASGPKRRRGSDAAIGGKTSSKRRGRRIEAEEFDPDLAFDLSMSMPNRAAEIRALVSSFSDPSLLDEPSTPQARALDWITNVDAIQPPLVPSVNTRCGILQRYILASFYYATDGDNWSTCSAPDDPSDPASVAEASADCEQIVTPFGVTNDRVGDKSTVAWLAPVDACHWGGIACWGPDTPGLDLCIDQLDFESNGLAGTLVPELTHLFSLRFLLLEDGDIAGNIPPLTLTRLQVLQMDSNQLNGTIPDELFGLPRLQQLSIGNNQITGSISSSIGNSKLLTVLLLDSNRLTGTIPESMGVIKNLRVAHLHENMLTGSMPQSVCANRNNAQPPGRIALLIADCGGPSPEVECACCSNCPAATPTSSPSKSPSVKWFMNWNVVLCQKECQGGYPCAGTDAPFWADMYDTVDECCDVEFSLASHQQRCKFASKQWGV